MQRSISILMQYLEKICLLGPTCPQYVQPVLLNGNQKFKNGGAIQIKMVKHSNCAKSNYLEILTG